MTIEDLEDDFCEDDDEGWNCPDCGAAEDEECEPDCQFDDEDD